MKCNPLTRFSTIILFVIATSTGFAADPNAPIVANGNTKIKLAMVGDSITAGSGTVNPRTDSYPAQLGQMLGDQWQVKNFGVSGATLLNNGDRPYQKTGLFQPAIAFKPDVVLIMLGTNDTKPQNWSKKSAFVADYKDLIGKFKSLSSNPRIFICYPPFVVGAGAIGISEAGVLEQIPMIDQIAKEESVGLIDIHGALKDKPELSRDKVHPKFEGVTVMARTAYKALTGKEYMGPAPTPGPVPTPKPKVATPAPSSTPVAAPSAS